MKKEYDCVLIKRKNGIHSVQRNDVPEMHFSTNYCAGVSGTNQFCMKVYYLQCKQFQFVDSMLFGQVRLAVFFGAVKIFSGKGGSTPQKNWPVCLRR